MIRKSRFILGAAALSMLVQPIVALANTPVGTDALREWNLIVLGNLDSNSEVEGRTFVGGDLTGNSSNYNINPVKPSANDQPGLTVVGSVTGSHKNLNNGSGAVIGGDVQSGFNLNGSPQTVLVGGSIANTNVNSNTVNSGLAASDPAFVMNLKQDASLIETSMTNLSHDLSTQPSNSALVISGNRGTFNAQPDASGTAIFNISADDLNAIGEIQFNLNGADTAIVNVSGSAITLNDNFLGGTQNLGESVIWNFPEAESLNLTTAWGGSVLAPRADARTANYIQGSAVFGSLEQRGEMHVGTYAGSYSPPPANTSSSGGSTSSGGGTPVPEPGVFGLMGMALASLVFLRRRKLKPA
jgi:choice-of-anchor A domain-containing protein